MPEEVEILVAGRLFSGWNKVNIARSVENLSGTFNIQGRDSHPSPVREGEELAVLYGGERVMTGVVDQVNAKYSTRVMTIKGRDRTRDVIDSTGGLSDDGAGGVDENLEFDDLTLEQLANKLAEPFGVSARLLQTDPGPVFPRFAIKPSEKAFQGIERACRMRGVLAYPDGDGNLVLSTPGFRQTPTDIVAGQNMVDADQTVKAEDRFSVYLIRGQRPGGDDEDTFATALVEGSARDPVVTRFRPLKVMAEGALDEESAAIRAKWEMMVRAARAEVVAVQVKGWREVPRTTGQSGRRLGISTDLWSVNMLTALKIPRWKIDTTMLLSEVNYIYDQGSARSTLKFVPKDSYKTEAGVEADESPFSGLRGEWAEAAKGRIRVRDDG